MHRTVLRKVGGSVMLTVLPAILDLLDLRAGTMVGLTMEGERLVVEATSTRRYRLEDPLDLCDPTADSSAEDREWSGGKPVGDELI